MICDVIYFFSLNSNKYKNAMQKERINNFSLFMFPDYHI